MLKDLLVILVVVAVVGLPSYWYGVRVGEENPRWSFGMTYFGEIQENEWGQTYASVTGVWTECGPHKVDWPEDSAEHEEHK